MRPLARVLCVGAALLSAHTPVMAQSTIDGTDPEAIASILRGFGSARIGVAGDETPMISGRIEGTTFSVYFYGCDDEHANCRSVSFSAGWEADGIDIEAVNEWNRRSRFGRAYIDEEGDPILEMDVNLYGSVSKTNFDDTADWWRVVLEDFETTVIEAEAAVPPTREAPPPGTSL